MIKYLNIIRWKNLLFIVLIQLLIQHLVVFPILETYGFTTSLNSNLGLMLVFGTVLIAAGGYVINDYFDVKIDRINKPHKVLIPEIISKKSAMLYYQILTGSGIFLGLLLSYLTKSFSLGFIFILVPGLLWFYSSSYKRQFLWGNLIVSLLAALTALSVGVLEVSLLKKEYSDLVYQTDIPKVIYGWTGGFALFAFLATWIREIIKDIEDEAGDRELECRTMPIKWGVKNTKYFLYFLVVFTIATILHVNFHFITFEGNLTLRYIISGIIAPYLALILLIFRAKSPADYKYASILSKAIMLIGVLYSFVFYYLEAKQYGLTFFGLFIIQK